MDMKSGFSQTETVEPLIMKLTDRNIDNSLRKQIVVALVKKGNLSIGQWVEIINKNKDELRVTVIEGMVEIGKSAIESIIDILFELPDINTPIDSYQFHPLNGKLFLHLFGDYTDLILNTIGGFDRITKEQKHHEYDDWLYEWSYEYKLDRMVDAVNKLCSVKTPVSDNLLLKVSQRQDIKVISFMDSYGLRGEEYMTLILEPVRKIARDELRSRGNPPYLPLAYIEDNVWDFQA
jgi:hypothetical protein